MNSIPLKPIMKYKRAHFEDRSRVPDEGAGAMDNSLQSGHFTGFSNPNAEEMFEDILTPTDAETSAEVSFAQATPSTPTQAADSGTRLRFKLCPSRTGNRSPSRCLSFWRRASLTEQVLGISIIFLLFVILTLVMSLNRSATLFHHRVILDHHLHDPNGYCLTPQCITVASSIINAMNAKVDPCDDFYEYTCGGWIRTNPIPDGKSIWGTFGKLWRENQLIMKNVLEDETKITSEAERTARTYYQSCLDVNDTIESLGAKPMMAFLDDIGGWSISNDTKELSLQTRIALLHNKYNRGGLFSWAIGADEKNSSLNIIQLDQAGLGLPSRNYYLNKSSDDTNVMDAYVNFMSRIGMLLGGEENRTQQLVADIVEFETRLANITMSAADRRDEEELYHRLTLKQLQENVPFLNWTDYFRDAFNVHNSVPFNVTDELEVVVYSLSYFRNLSSLIEEYLPEQEETLNNYLTWSAIQSLTSCLSKPFREAYKQLRRALIGSAGTDSHWRFCVTDTNGVMGFALGAMFVESVFDGSSKAIAQSMIDQIKTAFKNNLPNLDWMDADTRRLAAEKANAITDMIGFPDFILDTAKLDARYEALHFDEDKYFDNNIAISRFALQKNLEKITKHANRSEWEMSPPTVNAYYTPTKNQIVFPAGILQTPFYDVSYPKSLNFGAMGVVMGHELTHAFDDQGREYDLRGNLHPWWNNETLARFETRIKCFTDQYDGYSIGNRSVNGKQTLGENIADNGGLKAAYNAYGSWIQDHGHEAPLPGVNLTHEQLFFVGFAQVWCSVTTKEALALQLAEDAHSPSRYRVIGTLSNSVEFANTFKCPKGSPMNPTKKCEVW